MSNTSLIYGIFNEKNIDLEFCKLQFSEDREVCKLRFSEDHVVSLTVSIASID